MYRYAINVVMIWGDNLFSMYVLFSHLLESISVYIHSALRRGIFRGSSREV